MRNEQRTNNARTHARTHAMRAPQPIVDGLKAMHAERAALADRLHKLDVAIQTVSLAYGVAPAPQPEAAPQRRQQTARTQTPRPVADDSGEAQARREAVLKAIGQSEVGLTISELRKATAKLDGKDRSNALQQLKMRGEIKRAGNAWVKAA